MKIVLRPDHHGAIVEFKDVAGAGKAALGIDGVEIVEGRKVTVGSVGELLKQKEEMKGPIEGGGKGLQASAVVKRPTQKKKRGGTGELGIKRGSAMHATTRAVDGDEQAKAESNGVDGAEGKPKAKSNADFKAMFLKE